MCVGMQKNACLQVIMGVRERERKGSEVAAAEPLPVSRGVFKIITKKGARSSQLTECYLVEKQGSPYNRCRKKNGSVGAEQKKNPALLGQPENQQQQQQ